jgi:hypothetical protein
MLTREQLMAHDVIRPEMLTGEFVEFLATEAASTGDTVAIELCNLYQRWPESIYLRVRIVVLLNTYLEKQLHP